MSLNATIAKPIKPTDRAIATYYADLQAQRALGEHKEGSTRIAFENLLRDVCAPLNWTVTAEKTVKVGPRSIRLDGIVRDPFGFRMGYWEAKDAADDLDREIRKKFEAGYPTSNIIFEDTHKAVLIQNGQEAMRADLAKPENLAGLLTSFIRYTEPDILEFRSAIEEFHDVIPELGRKLIEIIRAEYKENHQFKSTFDHFADLCRHSINPNLATDAVQEMIAQHLLTERLIRKVFENQDFTRRNAIAAEIEKVIDSLTGRSFSRDSFMQRLDRFYLAIEKSAEGQEFREKQTLLNQVYERFFQGFAVKVADTHGIVYTPQEIVQFMVGSVAEVLKTEFNTHLGADGVVVLDPCTGTGNFLVNVLQHIATHHPSSFKDAYRKRMFANEVMLMPYYIASLNIENLYYEQEKQYLPFEGLCFVDTLDLAETRQPSFSFMSQENTERVRRQRSSKINVIIGNPPYNAGQINENDNNKNRKYEVIDQRVRDTYAKDSKATLKNSLYDPYVKFFRWATDKIAGEDNAIVCMVTNNSFLDQLSFDGMRKHLADDYDTVYHIDCRGNVRQNPELSGTAYNVFGIQVGAGITIAVRRRKQRKKRIYLYQMELKWRRQAKLAWLQEKAESTGGTILAGIDWADVKPDKKHNWLTIPNADEFESFLPIGSKEAKAVDMIKPETIFKSYSGGVKTNRDELVYDFSRESLENKISGFIENYNSEVDRFKHKRDAFDRLKTPKDREAWVDQFVDTGSIKWDGTLKTSMTKGHYAVLDSNYIKDALYRPFTSHHLYFDDLLINSVYRFPSYFPKTSSFINNVIWLKVGPNWPMFGLMSDKICDLLPQSGSQCFPMYTYTESGERRENITDWALEKFQSVYEQPAKGKNRAAAKITKTEIFHYVYAVLHHPVYRERFADALKKELPRIPFLMDFHSMATAGAALASLHLNYEQAKPYALKEQRTGQRPPSQLYIIDDRMRLSKDKTALVVNDGLTLEGIPPETFQYRLGNRSALDWVIDQYQLERDKTTQEITSNPNRDEDPEYIVMLVKQIISVSLETNRIVAGLPGFDVIEPNLKGK
ncbi:MAG: type ISP restriction/modification enzyme [Planctomycetota bacterium]